MAAPAAVFSGVLYSASRAGCRFSVVFNPKLFIPRYASGAETTAFGLTVSRKNYHYFPFHLWPWAAIHVVVLPERPAEKV